MSQAVQPQPRSRRSNKSVRAKRVRIDDANGKADLETAPEAVAHAADPKNVYVILKKPSFMMNKPAISNKNIKRADDELVAHGTEICGPAFASPEAAQESAQSLFIEFVNGEIFFVLEMQVNCLNALLTINPYV